LSFTAYDFSPFAFAQPNFGGGMPMADPTRGRFVLGPNALLGVAGLIIDDRADTSTANTLPISTNGGSIAIRAFTANIAQGSQIDVSGGVRVDNTGKATYGNGGSISIFAGQDANARIFRRKRGIAEFARPFRAGWRHDGKSGHAFTFAKLFQPGRLHQL
jgi:hypothetical protein